MKEKYLPLGSVVLLKEASKKVMIIGYCVVDNDKPDVMYDYAACMFPEGLITSEQTGLFNHDQIAQIFGLGFTNDESTAFLEKLKSLSVKSTSNVGNIKLDSTDIDSI